MIDKTGIEDSFTEQPVADVQISDAELAQKIGDQLYQQAAELDGATLSRLSQARNVALAEHDRPNRWRRLWSGLSSLRPAVGVALAATLALALGLGWLGSEPPDLSSKAGENLDVAFVAELDDLELLTAADEPELFAELEFYAWIDQGADGELDPQSMRPDSPGVNPEVAG